MWETDFLVGPPEEEMPCSIVSLSIWPDVKYSKFVPVILPRVTENFARKLRKCDIFNRVSKLSMSRVALSYNLDPT